MSYPSTVTSTDILAQIPDPGSALDTLRAELDAMPESRIQRRNTLDASLAVETVLGKLPDLRRLRPLLAERYGETAGQAIDRLPLLASATKRSTVELTLVRPITDLSPLSKEVVAMHALLLADAQAMANRGVLDLSRLDTCRSLVGYRNQYHSLLSIEALLRDAWPRVASRTFLTEADLDRARMLGQQMMAALGLRESSSAAGAANEVRIRALSLLVETYEEVRRNVTHLRWHEGDADALAPSLWTAQRGRRSARPSAPMAEPVAPDDGVELAPTSRAVDSAFEANGIDEPMPSPMSGELVERPPVAVAPSPRHWIEHAEWNGVKGSTGSAGRVHDAA
jgi:hypothetical protein